MSGAIQPITAYQPPDILGQAGQVAGLQNQLLQNQTGQQNLQIQRYQLNQDALAQTQARLGAYKSVLAPLMRLGPNVQPSDVYTALRGLSSVPGMPTDEIAADVANTMPVMDPKHASDPGYQQQYGRALQGWVQNQAGSTLNPEAQFTAFRPSIAMVNQGGVTTPTDVNPSTNPGITGQSFPMSLTPAEAVSGQNFTTPGGVPYFETNKQIAQQTGQGNLVAGGSGGGGGGAPAGNSIFGNGRLPGRGAPHSGPQAGSAGPSAPTGSGSAVPPGTIQTGLSPAQQAAQQQAGGGSGADLHAFQLNQSSSGARLFQLGNALTAMTALGTTGTGPGTDVFNNLKSTLLSIPGLGSIMPGVDPNKIANYDEANKYLTQYASSLAGNLGAGTDAKLATTLSGNPSTHISNLAGVNVIKATMGLERMQQAESAAFTASGLSDDQFDKFAANWSRTNDPRAYAFDLLSPQQRASTLASIGKGPALTTFLNQVWSASQGGFVDGGKLGLAGGGAPTPAAPATAPRPASGPPIDPSTGLPVGITP